MLTICVYVVVTRSNTRCSCDLAMSSDTWIYKYSLVECYPQEPRVCFTLVSEYTTASWRRDGWDGINSSKVGTCLIPRNCE